MSGVANEPDLPESDRQHRLGPSRWVIVGDEIQLRLRGAVIPAMNDLLGKTGDSPDDLMRKALALYKLSVDAHEDGKAVGVAASSDVLETEFVGF